MDKTYYLWSWGHNTHTQLGHLVFDDNGEVSADQPTAVFIPTHVPNFQVTRLSCGQYHTLALTDEGQVFSWGMGALGQLGHGSRANVSLPRYIDGISDRVTGIAAGLTHSICSTVTGTVFCWGEGAFGKLGQGVDRFDDQLSPIAVEGLPTVGKRNPTPEVLVYAGGNMSLATFDGEIWDWGWNKNGQLGLGFSYDAGEQRGIPTPSHVGTREIRAYVERIDKIKQAHYEEWFQYILTPMKELAQKRAEDGDAWAEKLYKDKFSRSENGLIEELIKLIKEAVVKGGVTDDLGRLLEMIWTVWQSDKTKPPERTDLEPEYTFKSFAIGERHVAAVTPEGQLWLWGGNGHCQLGIVNKADISRPMKSEFKDPVAMVSCGMSHTAIVTKNGEVYTWGWKELGRCGYDIRSTGDSGKPTKVEGELPGEIVSVACNEISTIVKTKKGDLWAWGQNMHGQMGFWEAESDRVVPHQPLKLLNIGGVSTQIVAGNFHSFALLSESDALFQFARTCDKVGIRSFIESGKEISRVKDPDTGATVLHMAAQMDQKETIAYLADLRPALLKAVTRNSQTPMHYAAEAGAEGSIKLLHTLGASIDVRDREGRSPLHLAAQNNQIETVKVLVELGASLDQVDSLGKSPKDYMSKEAVDSLSKLRGFDVVVSSAIEQATFALTVARSLSKQNIPAWADDGTGADKAKALSQSLMGKRIRESRAVVWVVSKHSLNSERCKEELMMAKELNKKLFPIWFPEVIIKMTPELEQIIFRQQLVDFSKKELYKDSVTKLCTGIRNALETKKETTKVQRRRGAVEYVLKMEGCADYLQQMGCDPKTAVDRSEITDEEKQLVKDTTRATYGKEYFFLAYHPDEEKVAESINEMLYRLGWPSYLGSNRLHDKETVNSMLLQSAGVILILSERAVKNSLFYDHLMLAENRDVLVLTVQVSPAVSLNAAMQYSFARTPRYPPTFDGIKTLVYSLNLARKVQVADLRAKDLRKGTLEANTKREEVQKEVDFFVSEHKRRAP